jgi:protein-L-isoaspartate(D-aspartate) O-methyltransferase
MAALPRTDYFRQFQLSRLLTPNSWLLLTPFMSWIRFISIGLLLAMVILVLLSGREFFRGLLPSLPGAGWGLSNGRSGARSSREPREEAFLATARQRMVADDLHGRDITDEGVLAVMGRVPRERFVADAAAHQAYDDHPLEIGFEQTISQPYIVALMTQLAKPNQTCRALDIGTGSGYQAAVLAELCREVYSTEIIKPLADEAARRLADLGYKNITVRCGDGYQGWPEKAPFDLIIVAAAPEEVPQPLVEQLVPGGRLVVPVGRPYQELLLVTKQADGSVRRESIAPVAFVPMRGRPEER